MATPAAKPRERLEMIDRRKRPSMPPEATPWMTHQVERIVVSFVHQTTASAMPTETKVRTTVIVRKKTRFVRGVAFVGAKRFQ